METKSYSISLKGDIVHLVFNVAEVTLEEAERIVEISKELSKGEPHRILIDSRKVSFASREVQQVSNRDEVVDMTIARAILVSSTLSRMLANSFLKVIKPKSPTRMFDSEKKALEWLNNFPASQ